MKSAQEHAQALRRLGNELERVIERAERDGNKVEVEIDQDRPGLTALFQLVRCTSVTIRVNGIEIK